MPMVFTCAHCGTRIHIDEPWDSEPHAGQSWVCTNCGQTATAINKDVGSWPSPAAKIALVLAGFGLTLILCCGTIPAINAVKTNPRKARCMCNQREIFLAMQAYHAVHGQYPPAFTLDERGARLHSWRVLLLPYLGRQDLYRQIRLDEPWGSAHNQAIAAQRPVVYCCPANRSLGPTETCYRVVVGPRTMFPGSLGRAKSDVRHHLAMTVMLAETNSGVPWMKPEDLEFDRMSFRINDAREQALGSFHGHVAVVTMADGAVAELSDSLDPEIVQQMIVVE